MNAYQICGGNPLCGEISVSGAKNAVLPILAATMVVKEASLHQCPDISDLADAIRILEYLGADVLRQDDCLQIDTYSADRCEIPPCMMEKMRAAVIFLGALLCRFGEAKISHPGGCKLGERPIDLHLMGLRHMGYRCEFVGQTLCCREEKLRGCTIALPFPSVGATENLLLAALRCPQEVILCNAAREPEIGDLISFLRKCGARIDGENTSVLRICGGQTLHGTEHTIMPDRMEAATYLCAAAATRGKLCIKNVCPRHLAAVTAVLCESNCKIKTDKNEIVISCPYLTATTPIRTAPYDAFPTDAQAPMMAALATADGVSVFEENIFSDRYRHVPALNRMGAKIYAADRYAVVRGVERLTGASVEATDLRGGAAMVIAALSACGESRISNIAHIQRGYANFSQKLASCGAQIKLTE